MDPFPGVRDRPQVRLSGFLLGGAALVVLLLLILGAVDFTTEWLWFDSLGFVSVFVTTTTSRIGLFVAGSILFLLLFAANVLVARHLAYSLDIRPRRAAMNAT